MNKNPLVNNECSQLTKDEEIGMLRNIIVELRDRIDELESANSDLLDEVGYERVARINVLNTLSETLNNFPPNLDDYVE